MSVIPFYWNYDINTDNIDCWRIIVVWCDGLHSYVDPCQVLEECFRVPEIDWCNMVVGTPTQSAVPWAQPGYLLWVNPQWNCLEWYDPCQLLNACGFDDRLVAASPNDQTPGTLLQKLVSCNTGVKINITEVPGIDAKVRLCLDTIKPSDIDWQFPNCPSGGWVVRFNNSGFVFDCDDPSALWAQRYTSQDVTITYTLWVQNIRWFLITSAVITQPWFITAGDMDIFQGNPAMSAWIWAIQITRTGMYNVWIKGNARINNGVQALRLFLWTSNSKTILCDAKFGAQAWPDRPLLPDNNTTWYYELHAQNLVRLNVWDVVVLWGRIDANAGTWVDPNVILARSALKLSSAGTPEQMANPEPGLTFGVSFHSATVHNAP